MRRRVIVRGLLCVVVALLVAYGALRSYVVYEAHRGAQILEALAKVQIGDSKESVMALAKRLPGRVEIDPPNSNAFGFGVSPWFAINSFGGPSDNVLLTLVRRPFWRRAIRLRDFVGGRISVDRGRVTFVVVQVAVEGRDGFLVAGWVLQSREPRGRPSSFHVQHLLGLDEDWQALTADITPESSETDLAAARNINLKCLTSFLGCASLDELAPDAARRLPR